MTYGNYAPFYRAGFFNPMQPTMTPPMVEGQNQFAPPYQPPMQTPTQPTAPTPQPIANDMIWVLNENEATSYPVAPNTSVVLWDKGNSTVYVKSANAQGIPSMRILDFKERAENSENSPVETTNDFSNRFILKEDFNALETKFEDISSELDELKVRFELFSSKNTTKTTKKKEE